MNLKKLRRCTYLLTLLASTVPSVVFGQTALAISQNGFYKPLEPSNPSVNCYCPRPYIPINREYKSYIPDRYCPDYSSRFQNKIQCPLYGKPSINSTSISQPIIVAKEADEGRSFFGSLIDDLKGVANPEGSQPRPGEDSRDFRMRTGKGTETQLDRDRRSTVREVTGEKHIPGGGPQDY